MKKLLLGLGVPKAGTTWAYWALSQHPQVGRIPRKELHYFLRQYGAVDRLTDASRLAQFAQHVRRFSLSHDQADRARVALIDPDQYGAPEDPDQAGRWQEGAESDRRYRVLVEQIEWYKRHLRGPVDDVWYRALFGSVPQEHWAVDFSTTNFLASDRGFADMAQFAEDTRAILILRDPIDRLWSHIRFHAEVTRDFPNLGVWSVQAIRDFAQHHELHLQSFYAPAVKRLMTHFPEDRRLIINFDRIRTEPAEVYGELLDFLDLAPMALPHRQMTDSTIAASQPLVMRPGLMAHLAPDYVRDLKELQEMGLEFVDPWIEHAEAHGRQHPEWDPMAVRSLGRRLIRRMEDERMRRALLRGPRRPSVK